MRLAILTMCMLAAASVFAAMFHSIWSSRRDGSRPQSSPPSLAAELVWAAIPCLMILAAATPAVIQILSGFNVATD